MNRATQQWHLEQLAAVRRVAEMREEQERARVENMTQKLRAKRLARVTTPAPANDSGDGWRRVPGPTSDAALEQFVRAVHDVAFHGINWPAGWRAAWGETDGAYAKCIYDRRLILIDRRKVHTRDASDFLRTLVPEVVHVYHEGVSHGPAFKRTLDSALAFVRNNPTIRRRLQEFLSQTGGSRQPLPKETIMDFDEMPLERRPAPGSSSPRREHFAGARSSLKEVHGRG